VFLGIRLGWGTAKVMETCDIGTLRLWLCTGFIPHLDLFKTGETVNPQTPMSIGTYPKMVVWRLPEMGAPLKIHHSILICSNSSIQLLGYPHFMDTSILLSDKPPKFPCVFPCWQHRIEWSTIDGWPTPPSLDGPLGPGNPNARCNPGSGRESCRGP
jgi:hypothetical protein